MSSFLPGGRHIVRGRTLGLCIRISGSVFIRSVSATPVVACALNPHDGSSSSGLTSTSASVLTFASASHAEGPFDRGR
jgi:hypothetical protein